MKMCVLSFFLNSGIEERSRRDCGSEFPSLGAVAQNALRPINLRLNRGTTSKPMSEVMSIRVGEGGWRLKIHCRAVHGFKSSEVKFILYAVLDRWPENLIASGHNVGKIFWCM